MANHRKGYMKKLLCILMLFVSINVCASESSMNTHSHTTRLKSGAIKRKDMSDDQDLLYWQEYQEADSKQPEPKKFKPMPSTPPLTATTSTQEPSQMDLLQKRLENLSPKTEQSPMIESQAIVPMTVDIITRLTQRVEVLEKQREEDKKELAALIESFNKRTKFITSPSKTSHELFSQTSCDYQIFKHEGSAAMILDFGLGEIGLDQ